MEAEKLNLEQIIKRHEAGTLVGVFQTTNEDYHNAPGISKSGLDDVEEAPAKFKWRREHPEPASDEMQLGSALHVAILEPEEFEKRYAVAGPELTRRGTNKWLEFEQENQGKIPLKFDQGEKIFEMAMAARKHSRALLLEGLKELSFFWKDPETGLLCKCRPDNITAKGVISDYKSTRIAYPERVWAREILIHRYHVQAAFYLDGVLHALAQANMTHLVDVVPSSFVLFAQEKVEPFLSKPWLVGEASIALGRRAYQTNLRTIKECEKSGVWPGYPEKIEPIECPEYAWQNELDSEDESHE